ncbi:MAG TPA: ABC transporter permease [bacterium]|nr:ABC transporter permease [bacterium]
MINASVAFVAFRTIVRKEVVRFMRIWTQTLLPSAITQSLYFLIFGAFIGSQIAPVKGVSYMAFIIPGIVMMAIIMNSYLNVASSFFGAKFQRHVEELLVSPTPDWVILSGYVAGGVLRGMLVGLIVFAVSWAFVHPTIAHPFIILLFGILTALVFSLGGFVNAIFARKFDDVSIVPTFILTPLTYLGGVFYSIDQLPEFWRTISHANPIVYMVDGFRYGFYGFTDISVWISAAVLLGFSVVLTMVALWLLRRGTGMRT